MATQHTSSLGGADNNSSQARTRGSPFLSGVSRQPPVQSQMSAQFDPESFVRPEAENATLFDPRMMIGGGGGSTSISQGITRGLAQGSMKAVAAHPTPQVSVATAPAGVFAADPPAVEQQGMAAPGIIRRTPSGGPSGYQTQTVDKLINEIQAAYFDITRLEDRSAQLMSSLDVYSQRADKTFEDLYVAQTSLINKYFDFMFLAHHPTGNSVTRSLVRKYKIALRLWNKGILKYLDLLRTHSARNQDAMTKFIFHCFSLLTMLVDKPYDYRHMWLEALGDIARFSMAIGSVSNGDWRGISQYWYCRAANRSPGVGRLFHHCAVVCIYRLDSLYYFCKSLLSLQPFAPSSETILSLFESNSEGEGNTPVAAFIKLHEMAFRNEPTADHSDAMNTMLPYVLSAVRRDHEFLLRGAMLALCNIAALMSYGSRTNPVSDYFFEVFVAAKSSTAAASNSSNQGTSPVDTTGPASGTTGAVSSAYRNVVLRPKSTISFLLPFEMLRQFLVLETNVALSHVLVWMHFLSALSASPAMCTALVLDARFPTEEFVTFLNKKLENVKNTLKEVDQPGLSLRERIVRWKSRIQATGTEDLLARLNRQTPGYERRGAFPGVRQRPLPEELLLVGYVWFHSAINPQWHKDYESATTDEPFPGHPGHLDYVPVRIVRIYEVALNIVATGTWLHFDGQQFSIDYEGVQGAMTVAF